MVHMLITSPEVHLKHVSSQSGAPLLGLAKSMYFSTLLQKGKPITLHQLHYAGLLLHT